MFQDCKPHNFSGTEGAVGLLRWLEKVESAFSMCNCPEEYRVKYASGTFEGRALTWWNSTVQTIGLLEAHALPWTEFVFRLKREYCPRDEIKSLEHELWNHQMVGSEVEEYTTRYHELALLCPDSVTPEYKAIEFYISGLVPEVRGLVTANDATTLRDTIRLAHRLTKQKVQEGVLPPKGTVVKTSDGNKRKWESAGKGTVQPQ